ncbi:hypothetical protein [uncultured Campylobacter sp.]|uniref:hypothetical protein n=1 Tax=uncultured Campylobacter sp. TaxID=218934 RepID=UPI00262CD1E8|nr:hypothetical protein [uncultured Campylobacter sp.]
MTREETAKALVAVGVRRNGMICSATALSAPQAAEIETDAPNTIAAQLSCYRRIAS